MHKRKPKKPTWIDVKKSMRGFGPSQFLELVKDLYECSEENRTFLHARFLRKDDSLKRYKKIVSDCLYPDVMEESEGFDFSRAKKAIKNFTRATADDKGSADLMIYYVECGNKFTLDYGDINEYFYDALIEMYEKAIRKVCELPLKKQEPFRKRLEKIMKSSDGIGWGYHDDLCHFYYESFR